MAQMAHVHGEGDRIDEIVTEAQTHFECACFYLHICPTLTYSLIYSDFVKSLDKACFPRLRDRRRAFDVHGIVSDEHIDDPYITRMKLMKYEDWVSILLRIKDADNVGFSPHIFSDLFNCHSKAVSFRETVALSQEIVQQTDAQPFSIIEAHMREPLVIAAGNDMAIPLLDAVDSVITPPLPESAGFDHVQMPYLSSIPDLPTVASGELCIRMYKIMQGYVQCMMRRNYREGTQLLDLAMDHITRAGHLLSATEKAIRSLHQQHEV